MENLNPTKKLIVEWLLENYKRGDMDAEAVYQNMMAFGIMSKKVLKVRSVSARMLQKLEGKGTIIIK